MALLTLPPRFESEPPPPLPAWMLSVAQARELKRLENSQFFLVRIRGNAGIGEALICDPLKGGCGAKHDYLTKHCLERPFQGITAGLFGFWKVAGSHGAEAYLSPGERARVAALNKRFGRLGALPDLATTDPQMARSMGVAEPDVLWGAEALGLLEPISERRARVLAERINTRAHGPVIQFRATGGQHARRS